MVAPSLLRDYQAEARDWMIPRPNRYLGDEAGLGKTRVILSALEDAPVTVTCPAAIRDTEIWQDEALEVGFDAPIEVLSYHQFARRREPLAAQVVFDEAHYLKERKVSWGIGEHNKPGPARLLTKGAKSITLASGTPMPNGPYELWAQLSLIRPMPAYWTWIREWFDVYANHFSLYNISERLKLCTPRCPPTDCEHWDAFHEANLSGWMMRRLRDAVLTDLPPMSGQNTQLLTPMTPAQKRIARDLKKDFLAEYPEQGMTLEAMNDGQKFAMLWQCSTGLSTLDPTLPDKESGKLNACAEWCADRSRPTVVGVFFRNTALAVERMCQRLNLSYVMMGGNTPPKARLEAKRSFQAGSVDVMIGSVGVIKEGLTLTAADEIQLIERPWVPGDVEQLIRRIHRLGQTRPVTVRQAVTPQSVDSEQWKTLGDKQRGIRRVMSRVELESVLA